MQWPTLDGNFLEYLDVLIQGNVLEIIAPYATPAFVLDDVNWGLCNVEAKAI